MDDHEQDPEHSGAQRQGAQALFILQQELSVSESVEVVSLHGTCPLRHRHRHLRRVSAVPTDQAAEVGAVQFGVAGQVVVRHLHVQSADWTPPFLSVLPVRDPFRFPS